MNEYTESVKSVVAALSNAEYQAIQDPYQIKVALKNAETEALNKLSPQLQIKVLSHQFSKQIEKEKQRIYSFVAPMKHFEFYDQAKKEKRILETEAGRKRRVIGLNIEGMREYITVTVEEV